MLTKVCNHCKTEKSVDDFSIRKNTRGTGTVYRLSHCKSCMVLKTRAWQKTNKERFNKYQSEYHKMKYKENPESFRATWRRWYYKKKKSLPA